MLALAVAFMLSSIFLLGCLDEGRNKQNGAKSASGVTEEASEQGNQVVYIATIQPLAMILRELCEGRADVVCLLKLGASPHTYEPKPSDATAAARAYALFYVDDSLDGWAAKLDAKRKVKVFDLVPAELRLEFYGMHIVEDEHEDKPESESSDTHESEHKHEHSGIDAHFWTSPTTVKATLAALTDELVRLDPEGATAYKVNRDKLAGKLDTLDGEVKSKLAPFAGSQIVLFHPSFRYLMRDCDLKLAGVIEPAPGREPSPRAIAKLKLIVKERGVKALFSEPQLPKSPAETLAREAGLPLYELDPNGGVKGRETYRELIMYNVETLVQALTD